MAPDSIIDADEFRAEAREAGYGLDVPGIAETGDDRKLPPPGDQIHDGLIRGLTALTKADIISARLAGDHSVMAGKADINAQDQAIFCMAIKLRSNLRPLRGIGQMNAVGVRINIVFNEKGDTLLSCHIQQATVPAIADDQTYGLQRRQHGRDNVYPHRAGEEEAGTRLLLFDGRLVQRAQLSPR